MQLFRVLIVFILFSSVSTEAQETTALLLDAQSRQPVPYATVQYAPGRGVITNEDGRFSLTAGSFTDSLKISSLGYNPVNINRNAIMDTILLHPSSIELKDIFLTNKNLSGKEIVKKIKENLLSNYNFDLTQKRFFLRESNVNQIKGFNLLVDKSTIEELNQDFFNQIANNVPKFSDSYKEVLGDFYGNYHTQKLKIIKAANLHDPKSTAGLTDLMGQLENILQENIKDNSYVKIKTGVIGFKMDAEEFEKDFSEEMKPEKEPKEKNSREKEKELIQSQKGIRNSAASNVKSLVETMFWKEGIPLDILEKSGKYKFEVERYTQMQDNIVYIISFKPKRGADFKGKLYVNAIDFGVHRLDYENVKPLKKFRLFGISTAEDVYRGKMIFNRSEDGKYDLGFIEREEGNSFGIDRPLTIIEKNKFTAGRRKQNELDLDIKIHSGQVKKLQFVVYESSPLKETDYQLQKTSDPFEYETLKIYNPEFWNGYNIIEPNAAIKAFTVLNN